MKKRTRYFSLLIICALAISCKKSTIPTDKFFEGIVILRAEKNSPLGLIRLINIYGGDDMHMDEPRKAIVYRFSEQKQQFDLGEKVYLKIVERDKVQVACEVMSANTNNPPVLFSISERHQYIKHIEMNLHNADKHREGPKHKKVYTGSPLNVEAVPDYPNIRKVTVTVDQPSPNGVTSVFDTYYVESTVQLDPDTEYYTQFSYTVGPYDVHTFDLDHIH